MDSLKDKKEIRFLAENFRAVENVENEMVIEGYAVVFDKPATHSFTEIIAKTAFDKCDMSDVALKYNHEDNHLIIARTRNKSLQLIIDDIGLKVRAILIDTQSNLDIYKSIKAGLIDKMSFAFLVGEDEWDLKTNTRTIKSIERLLDVSVVDMPFYDSTSIYARALSELEGEKEKLENLKGQREITRKKTQLKIK